MKTRERGRARCNAPFEPCALRIAHMSNECWTDSRQLLGPTMHIARCIRNTDALPNGRTGDRLFCSLLRILMQFTFEYVAIATTRECVWINSFSIPVNASFMGFFCSFPSTFCFIAFDFHSTRRKSVSFDILSLPLSALLPLLRACLDRNKHFTHATSCPVHCARSVLSFSVCRLQADPLYFGGRQCHGV